MTSFEPVFTTAKVNGNAGLSFSWLGYKESNAALTVSFG
jgi:hypothetical protein